MSYGVRVGVRERMRLRMRLRVRVAVRVRVSVRVSVRVRVRVRVRIRVKSENNTRILTCNSHNARVSSYHHRRHLPTLSPSYLVRQVGVGFMTEQ